MSDDDHDRVIPAGFTRKGCGGEKPMSGRMSGYEDIIQEPNILIDTKYAVRVQEAQAYR